MSSIAVKSHGFVTYLQQISVYTLDFPAFLVTQTIILAFKEKTCKPPDKTLLELKNPVVVNKLF